MRKIYYNATFHTMDSDLPIAKVLVAQYGKVMSLFPETPDPSHRVDAEWIDLGGAHVYPGFTDAHTHSFEGGLYSLGVDLRSVKSLDELFQLLESANPIGGMIFASGYDENHIIEKRFPTVDELDRVVPDTPLLLRRVDGHSCALNSIAFRKIDWHGNSPSDSANPVRGKYNDLAAHWFHRNLDDEGVLSAYKQASELALKAGCTSIHTMVGDSFDDPLHYKLLESHLDDFPVEYFLYPQMFDVKKAVELGASRIGGCILVDGSFGSHTAGLIKPYTDKPETRGNLYRSDNFWQKFVQEASDNNLQVFVHAIGDAAIRQYVDAVKMLGKTRARELHHTVIHCELTNDRILDDMAEFGMYAAMQPVFDKLWGGPEDLYERVLGIERTRRTNRLKSMHDRGILIAGSTDWYITELNMLLGIHSAINHNNPDERLTLDQATQLFTVNPPKMIGAGDRLGLLKPGYQADMTCLSGEIGTPDASIQRVIKRNETVYKA